MIFGQKKKTLPSHHDHKESGPFFYLLINLIIVTETGR
jgi:hypothetical protein